MRVGQVGALGVLGMSALGRIAEAASPSSAGGATTTTTTAKASTVPRHGQGGGSDSATPDLTSSDTVAYSSRLIAAARALESRRRDRLFSDPYAERLAGPDAMEIYEDRQKVREEEEAAAAAAAAAAVSTSAAIEAPAPEGRKSRGAERRLAIRTRFCDDFFEDCAVQRGIKQIVSLGAGMDTRGLRLKASEGTKVFEVDQALVLRAKGALLTAAAAADEVAASVSGFRERRDGGVGQARVLAVEADLSVKGWEGELFEAGFDPSLPSAWILEGLTMYLDEQELLGLIKTLSALCSPGSAFCATCVSAESVVRAQASDSPLMGTWKWGSDDPQGFFEANFPGGEGWAFRGVSCGTPGEFPEGADYGVGFEGKAPAYVVGYKSASASPSSPGVEKGDARGGGGEL
ncbi:unnamed protein product [Scytosiphon promiscuus]